MNHKSKGSLGEEYAKEYLLQLGYEWIASNQQVNGGEIDHIFMDDQTLVFVEVKSDLKTEFNSPALRVSPTKQKQIAKCAQHFLNSKPNLRAYQKIRFDVVAVVLEPLAITHYSNAFIPLY